MLAARHDDDDDDDDDIYIYIRLWASVYMLKCFLFFAFQTQNKSVLFSINDDQKKIEKKLLTVLNTKKKEMGLDNCTLSNLRLLRLICVTIGIYLFFLLL